MLDIKFVRSNPDIVKHAIKVKSIPLELDHLLELDESLRKLKVEIETLQSKRNTISKQIPQLNDEEKNKLMAESKTIAQSIEQIKPKIQSLQEELQNLLWLVPNIPDPRAPLGKDESENKVIKQVGELPEFDFPLLDHVEILKKNNWVEFERIAKISGSRSYALCDEMVLLETALHRFALEKLKNKGFTLISMPSFAREEALYGTGHFPTGKDQVYFVPEDNIYLSGTAEVQINSLFSNELLNESDLPLLYAGISSCFRREAGSYGKDVRGLVRVHQFTKVEQYVFCKNDPEESMHWHQQLLAIAEEILNDLELPYQVVECCTGDMGAGKVKMFDIETWVPSEKKYRETHSCSALFDWQSRRTNTRYRTHDGKTLFCHTLNNTAIATPRILVPFLENHQQKNRSIYIPRALRNYMGNRELIEIPEKG